MTMASQQQTQEQARAAAAWKRILEVYPLDQRTNDKVKQRAGEYRALVRGAATDILTNGLGQSLAFLLAKDKGDKGREKRTPYWMLYIHLSGWVAGRDGLETKKFTDNDLLKWLIDPKQGSDVYRQTTVEVMAYLNWLKRFAEAELPEPKEQ
jgi:CRISPR-associated protein Cmr5